METFDNNSVIEIEKILATRGKIKEMIQKKINAQNQRDNLIFSKKLQDSLVSLWILSTSFSNLK